MARFRSMALLEFPTCYDLTQNFAADLLSVLNKANGILLCIKIAMKQINA